MTHSRTLFSPLIAALVMVSPGLHPAGALEARGANQYGVRPGTFFYGHPPGCLRILRAAGRLSEA